MNADNSTSMTLKNVSSGLTMALTGTSGTITSSATVMALTGYDIATEETGQSVSYNVVSVSGKKVVKTEPATVLVAVDYDQTEGFEEVDMDISYVNIPDQTSLEVDSSQSDFSLSKRVIEGTSNIGKSGKDLGPFSASMVIGLWITQPDAITDQSALTLKMSKIEGGDGGPVKKTLLGQIVINLSNT